MAGNVGPLYLLDSINATGAAAAYSLRRLTYRHTGSAIRVRRSSDNAETDIGFDGDGNLNTAALLSFVGANNGFVTTWYDQSGNRRNATQTTAGNQLRIVGSGAIDTQNGKPTVYHDGTFSKVLAATQYTSSNSPYSIFTAVANKNQTIVSGEIDTVYSFSQFSTSNKGLALTTANSFGSTTQRRFYAEDMSPLVPTLYSNSNSSSLNLDYDKMYVGTYLIGSNPYTSANTYFRIGQLQSFGGQLYAGNNSISEIIVYEVDKSQTRLSIESNLNNYYKIY